MPTARDSMLREIREAKEREAAAIRLADAERQLLIAFIRKAREAGMLTVPEIAALLRCTPKTVYNMLSDSRALTQSDLAQLLETARADVRGALNSSPSTTSTLADTE